MSTSGTYAAIRLQQLGKKVALIEQKDRLGGMLRLSEVKIHRRS